MTLRKNIQNDQSFINIGFLKKDVAKAIGITPGYIKVSANYLKHIKNKHGDQLKYFGFSPKDFLKFIVENFNQVYKGSGDSYLLVVYDEIYPKVLAIELNIIIKEKFWEVKTAQPRRCNFFNKKTLLYKK